MLNRGNFFRTAMASPRFKGCGTDADATKTVGQLQLEFDLSDEWHLLAPGTYQLPLKIGGANVAPIDGTIEFTHTGAWTNDDVSIRPVQIDYERQRVPVVDTGGPTPIPPIGVNGLRYSAGIVLNF
jgi:hypothetical protein